LAAMAVDAVQEKSRERHPPLPAQKVNGVLA
jgi:hypothetical protein